MHFEELFRIQKELDEKILEQHNLKGADLIPAKILALQVELGELANETRCFKYWSKKDPSPKRVILEEYVDCLHFILSIGLEIGFTNLELSGCESEGEIVKKFHEVISRTSSLCNELSKENYIALFKSFLQLGKDLGYNWEEIEEAYLEKNRVNHQRQAEGY